jgi:phosphotransferase system HPr (HPr) family protein
MRICSAIVETVGRFQARVTIHKNNDVRDASSMLALMTLAAVQGTELILSARGPESEEVLESLVELLAGRAK